jgi:hypothetical protein
MTTELNETLTEYYPGSSRKKRQYEESEPEKPELDELPELGKPTFYLVNNQPLALYRIGAVARALNRKPVTIRKWESEGYIPVSPYKLPGRDSRGQRRLYSKEQIESLRQIAHEEGILYTSAGGQWKHIEKTQFKDKAAKAFNI